MMMIVTAQAKEANAPLPAPNLVTSVRIEYGIECLTDPATLLPHFVQVETHSVIELADETRRTDRTESYQFVWQPLPAGPSRTIGEGRDRHGILDMWRIPRRSRS